MNWNPFRWVEPGRKISGVSRTKELLIKDYKDYCGGCLPSSDGQNQSKNYNIKTITLFSIKIKAKNEDQHSCYEYIVNPTNGDS